MRNKVKDRDTIVIEGWMLDLDFDNYAELVIYAVVHYWTKFAGVCFYRRGWFAEWLKSDVFEVEYIIEKLCQKGFISKKTDSKGLVTLVAGLALGDGNE